MSQILWTSINWSAFTSNIRLRMSWLPAPFGLKISMIGHRNRCCPIRFRFYRYSEMILFGPFVYNTNYKISWIPIFSIDTVVSKYDLFLVFKHLVFCPPKLMTHCIHASMNVIFTMVSPQWKMLPLHRKASLRNTSCNTTYCGTKIVSCLLRIRFCCIVS